ncbi:hypothetical protein P154DRAFT_575420 [Amniculicola lignicola CBS 123094]|uniref:DUF6603 domain-containing protein n=1 Tax=Amniculicola lignicola CBS 123094 TaxID=1392246 RepID=A0A6A5WGL1_9PLEO|nr:hypothetical protein P154DRAFT_575420 [Amniculicola lignicola CBS 123094]
MAEDSPVSLLTDDKLNDVWTEFISAANGEITSPVVDGSGDSRIITCSSPKYWGCTFSTANVLDSFEIESDSDAGDSMILGLDDVGTAKEVTIDVILSNFGLFKTKLASPVGPIVEALKGAAGSALPTFQIDTSSGAKNGTWIITALPETLEIATALTFQLNADSVVKFGETVKTELQETLGISIPDIEFSEQNLPRLRLKNKTFIYKKNGSLTSGSLCELIVQIPFKGYLINLRIDSGGRLGASLLNNGGTFADLANILSDAPLQSEADPQDGDFLSNAKLWCMSADFPDDPTEKVTFTIGFIVTFKLEDQNLVIGLHYDGREKTFRGGLLFQDMFKTRLDPDFDDLTDLPRGMLKDLSTFYDLKASSPFDELPSSVPTRLTQASIMFRKGARKEKSTFEFSAAMESASVQSANPPPDGSVPFPFEWTGVSISFRRQWGGTTTKPQVNINVFSSFQLNPPSDKYRKGVMSINFSYVQGGGSAAAGTVPQGAKWSLTGTAEHIQFGSIAAFLDPDLNGEAVDILGKLAIDSLEVNYTFQKNVASSFLFTCTISMGSLLLKLYYQYASTGATNKGQTAAHLKQANSAGKNPNLQPMAAPKGEAENATFWQLDAYLDTADPGATIGSIADSIMDNASANIPPFVSDIEVHPPSPSAKLITIHAGKTKKKSSTGVITERATFLLSVSISTVEFTFAQVSKGVERGTKTPGTVKRLLRLSVGRLPFIDSLPVVKELPQPYQELQYMWSPALGLSRDEVAALNEKLELEGSDNKLYFKAITRAAQDPNALTDPVVLLEGHHFIVVQDNRAIIDHIFKPDPKPSNTTPGAPAGRGAANATGRITESETPAAGRPQITSAEEAPPSKGAMRKSTPFITIDAISFQYKKSRLWIFVDGTIALGPLQFSLLGFGVGIKLDGLKLNDLSTIAKVADGIDFQLRGMEVAFDKPPILIAGCFYHDIIERNGQTENAYRGGIAVTVPPYTFVAVGEYAEVTTKTGTYKSVFVFAKLDGPIIDFQFAILRGLRIGFGYNSMVRSPAVEELHDFPLLSNGASDGAGNHPMKILENMRGGERPWIQLKPDAYWLAFGFTISSFNIISATAVALVSFRDGGPIFSIMGNLTCSMPPDPPHPMARLFYVEIDLYAELNLVEDCFKVLAALAPSSFVYVPMARLHGGLALYSFFGRNPHAGDWVFTVGGYHRSFKKPEHYPIVRRVGLDFNIDIISIRGEGYFAITPKAVMAGAMIRCELHIGPVFAWLDAAFDAMVQFEPMHYWVSMHVEVGVECDIPLLFFTIHIRISLGAYLEIEGPDFGGTAYVDFWFFSFSFDFGAKARGPPPINLQKFYELCEKSGPPDNSSAGKATDGLTVQIKISLEDGAFTMSSEDKKPAVESTPEETGVVVKANEVVDAPDDTGAGVKWFVKGGNFQFRVSTVFALTEAFIETEDSSKRDKDGKMLSREEQLKKPSVMKEVVPKPSTSRLSSMPMQLSAQKDGPNGIVSRLAISIRDVDEEGHAISISDFKPSFVVKPMPQALWANPASAPPDRLSADKGTVDLPMAVTLEAPDPVLAYAKVPAFNATDMAKACAGANQIPQLPAVTQSDYLPVLDKDLGPLDQKWGRMKQTWIDSSTEKLPLANEISTLCSSLLGWDKLAADAAGSNVKPGSPEAESWKVPVNFQERLVRGTKREAAGIQDGLENFYLELPRMTAAAA